MTSQQLFLSKVENYIRKIFESHYRKKTAGWKFKNSTGVAAASDATGQLCHCVRSKYNIWLFHSLK